MGRQERDLTKRARIDFLQLSPTEWKHVGQFAKLLSVCDFSFAWLGSHYSSLVRWCCPTSILIGTRFDSSSGNSGIGNPPQGLVITCRKAQICAVFHCTQSRSGKARWVLREDNRLSCVYISHVFVLYSLAGSPPLTFANVVLDPTAKMAYFKKHWPEDLHGDVLSCVEEVVS
jgi:hypothetical protein